MSVVQRLGDTEGMWFHDNSSHQSGRADGHRILAIFTFMGSWQAFFWPLVMIKDEWLRTPPIGLLVFDSMQGRDMAASVMTMLPLVVLFVVGQKYFVKGIQ